MWAKRPWSTVALDELWCTSTNTPKSQDLTRIWQGSWSVSKRPCALHHWDYTENPISASAFLLSPVVELILQCRNLTDLFHSFVYRSVTNTVVLLPLAHFSVLFIVVLHWEWDVFCSDSLLAACLDFMYMLQRQERVLTEDHLLLQRHLVWLLK